MSADWIKMRVDLRTHPKVVRISSALKADRLRVIGGLFAAWSIFDAHSSDGLLEGYTLETLDDDLHWPGFAKAMLAVEWLVFDPEKGEGLLAPRFEEHNGQSAKRRAQESARKAASRTSSGDTRTKAERLHDHRTESGHVSASDADKKRAREEKRREEREEEKPNDRPKAKPLVSLSVWIDTVKAAGESPIPRTDSVWQYAEKVGLPVDFLTLAWAVFKARYTAPDAKKYRDWRIVFRKAVSENWLKLWWIEGEVYALTTAGKQAKLEHGGEA